MKIHIIGCSGTGKSYLAEKLSLKYSIPHYDLDDIQWDNSAEGYGKKMPTDKRDAQLKEVLKQQDWIIGGVYYAWAGDCFQDADIIYLLDLPKIIYKYRIIRRFSRRRFGFERGQKETLRSVLELLKWTNTREKVNLPQINSILDNYESKTVKLTSPHQVNRTISIEQLL